MPTAQPDLDALAPVLERFGLPAIRGAICLDGRGPVVVHRLATAEGPSDLVLRELRNPGGADPLVAQRAALAICERSGVPTIGFQRMVPAGALAWSASVEPLVEGESGTALLGSPRGSRVVARALGRVIGRLSQTPLPAWGIRAVARGFVPMRPTWASEVRAWVAHEAQRLRSTGLDVTACTDAVLGWVEDRLPAVDQATAFSLAHLELSPRSLLFRKEADGLKIAAVLGWQHAVAGDPALTWAGLLAQAPAVLAEIAAGVEEGGALEALAEPSTIARLEAYRAALALRTLRRAAERWTWHGDDAAAVQDGLDRCRLALKPGEVQERLRAARSEAPPTTAAIGPVSRREQLRRRLALACCTAPPLGSVQAPWVLSASACLDLHDAGQEGDDAPWLERGADFLGALGSTGAVFAAEAPERVDLDALAEQVLAPDAPIGMAISALAHGLRVLEVTDAPDAARGGVCSLVSGCLAEDRLHEGVDARTRAQRATLALHGIALLRGRIEDGILDPVEARARGQLRDAWDVLEMSVLGRSAVDVDAVAARRARLPRFARSELLMLPVLAALRHGTALVGDDLPPRGLLLLALFRDPGRST